MWIWFSIITGMRRWVSKVFKTIFEFMIEQGFEAKVADG